MSMPAVMGLSYSLNQENARIHNPNPMPITIRWSGHRETIPPGGQSKRLYSAGKDSCVADVVAGMAETSYGGKWCVLMPSMKDRTARLDDHGRWGRLREGWHLLTQDQFDLDPQVTDAIEFEEFRPLTLESLKLSVVPTGQHDEVMAAMQKRIDELEGERVQKDKEFAELLAKSKQENAGAQEGKSAGAQEGENPRIVVADTSIFKAQMRVKVSLIDGGEMYSKVLGISPAASTIAIDARGLDPATIASVIPLTGDAARAAEVAAGLGR